MGTRKILDICSGCGSRAFAMQCAGFYPEGYCEKDATQAAIIRSNTIRCRLHSAPLFHDLLRIPSIKGLYGVCASLPCSLDTSMTARAPTNFTQYTSDLASLIRACKPYFVFLEMAPWVLEETSTTRLLRSLAGLGFKARALVIDSVPGRSAARAYVLGTQGGGHLQICPTKAWTRLLRRGALRHRKRRSHKTNLLQTALSTAQPPSAILTALLTLNASLGSCEQEEDWSSFVFEPFSVSGADFQRLNLVQDIFLPPRWVSSPLALLDRQESISALPPVLRT